MSRTKIRVVFDAGYLALHPHFLHFRFVFLVGFFHKQKNYISCAYARILDNVPSRTMFCDKFQFFVSLRLWTDISFLFGIVHPNERQIQTAWFKTHIWLLHSKRRARFSARARPKNVVHPPTVKQQSVHLKQSSWINDELKYFTDRRRHHIQAK